MNFTKECHYDLARAATNSLNGMKAVWRSEPAFRQEIYLCIFLVPLALYINITSMLKFVLIILLGLLLVVETLNSALEAVVDRISLELHDQSKVAKDMGSAAVCMVMLMNGLGWIYAFYQVVYNILETC